MFSAAIAISYCTLLFCCKSSWRSDAARAAACYWDATASRRSFFGEWSALGACQVTRRRFRQVCMAT